MNTRGITEDTCQFWDYQVASLHGETVQVANYKDEYGNTIGQKIRKKDKSFVWKGSPNDCGLYGKWLWKDGGKMVVITEGEIDALSVSQAQGNKWPVVSLKNGASGALKDLQKDLEWLETFEQVILFFDQDKAGWTAVEQCVELFSPGKARVVHLPEGYKDANDLLKDGKATTIIDCIWRARTHRPDGIVKPQDILADALKPIEIGLPYPWPQLTAVTYGIRPRELIGVGAGTGVGKTDFVQEIVLNLLSEGVPVGLFFLEESPSLSLKKLAGKLVGKRFHIPGVPWAPDELRDAIMQLGQDVNFYNHEGVIAWDRCKLKMRYMAKAEGVKFFVLDNLTALVAVASDEKKELERIMAELSGLCHELDCTIMFISHLATPESGSHEEGARVSIRHFKGSRAIGFWSNFLIGLERDQQAEDTDERNTTTVRILKDRYTGNSLGYTFNLFYNRETGRLEEDLDLNPFG